LLFLKPSNALVVCGAGVEGECFLHSKDEFGVRYRFHFGFGCSRFGLVGQGDSSSGDSHRFVVPLRVDEASEVGNVEPFKAHVIGA